MTIIRYFDMYASNEHKNKELLKKLQCSNKYITSLNTENCYHIELHDGVMKLDSDDELKLKWILTFPFYSEVLKTTTSFASDKKNAVVIECGPRFNFSTAYSSNAVQICHTIGLKSIVRLEVSQRCLIEFSPEYSIKSDTIEKVSEIIHDRMTQCVYTEKNIPINSFDENLQKNPEPWFTVPVLEEGKMALEKVNEKLGLAFDDWDIKFYTRLFRDILRRNPTSVECFDLAQSNSEHSRHWFFKGDLIMDGKKLEKSLMEIITDTQKTSNKNNVIKFSDNSSAIQGFTHKKLAPKSVIDPSEIDVETTVSDIIFTAETHNMPTAVAPFSGATTGTGGRIRDVQAVGRGGHTVAGTAGYCVGRLHIPDFDIPWEDERWEYPYNFASPIDIIIEASNGASDYGNKFGEPLITGFVMSYGLLNPDNTRTEYVKPIMFSGGIGYMSHQMIDKVPPAKEMLLVKLGGPVYRIGVGGGAASSVAVQGDTERSAALDFGAVQRGDAEMGNRLNRVVRACIEAQNNPIQAIHDQGAGGNGNVLKELVEPEGAIVFTKEFQLGDPTITTLELWGAEYQENNAILCTKQDRKMLEDICARERCPVSFVGEVTGDGCMKLAEDSIDNLESYTDSKKDLPFDLNLEAVLGKMPRKVFELTNKEVSLNSLSLPNNLCVMEALERVLKLVSVGSKRYLTNKVDRCVTGLIAQQQCVGPLHTPLADFGMIALSYFDTVGAATSIGMQPIKGLLSPEAGARMAVAESLTNLVFAGITCLSDVKCSSNWMWSGKTGEEGGNLSFACRAMCELMSDLGIAADGGKDSLSMAAGVKGNKVKSPGTLVVSAYAPSPNITVKLEPYFKEQGSKILWVPITQYKYRLGGTALAQCYKQLGDSCPDVDDPPTLKNAFNATQELMKESKIISGHDISDGGLITCILEMAFAGLRGFKMHVTLPCIGCIEFFFNEELGLILEVHPSNVQYCINKFESYNVLCFQVGTTTDYGMEAVVDIKYNEVSVLNTQIHSLFKMWEETSYRLELLQANPECVNEEWNDWKQRVGPTYKVSFNPEFALKSGNVPVKVAVIREEGTNGDREMIATLIKAQFEVYDVTMNDLINNRLTLDRFQGIVFPGGFSFADTLGSAKGWAASIRFNDILKKQFNHFAFTRKNTFSLGVCNGCQLMALLGWINAGSKQTDTIPEIVLDHNKSGRFECRWSTVRINSSKSSSLWLSEMDGSELGIWVAHGEGRFTFKNTDILDSLTKNNQICLQYIDDAGNVTEKYPMNPNGSPLGVAGVCSMDGRHLAMMPHPERCTVSWQCAYPLTKDQSKSMDTPWQKMFHNAYNWAVEHI